jgi:hypothetical protein
MKQAITLAGLVTVLGLATSQGAANEMFITHELNMERAEAVAAVRNHVEAEEDWLFLAEFGLAGGAVTALKVCYLPLGPDIMEAGLHVMALMPCGNMAFYDAESGATELSLLDPAFMTELSDAPSLERAVETGRPAFQALLADTLGIE